MTPYHNDTQYSGIEHNNELNMALSIMVECCYAECHLCKVSIMLSVENKPIMQSVIMLSFIILSVAVLEIIILLKWLFFFNGTKN
jgi:hypothetical protein